MGERHEPAPSRLPARSGAAPVGRPLRPVPFDPPTIRDRADPIGPAPADPNSGSILEQHRAAPPITITHEMVVVGDVADALWETFDATFAPLAEVAVQTQSSGRDEMLAEFADPRIRKIVAWEQGHPVGLGMITNHLESVPDISPAFLRARYPDHAANDSIFVGMYVMVARGRRSLTLFNRLYLEIWQVPARVGGVLIFDVCEHNRDALQTELLTERVAASFPRSTFSVLDRQTWYAVEMPEPMAPAPVPPRQRRRNG